MREINSKKQVQKYIFRGIEKNFAQQFLKKHYFYTCYKSFMFHVRRLSQVVIY